MVKFFFMKKISVMSMDKYLIEMKEVLDLIEEVNVFFFKNVVVWYILKNLLNEYEVLK